MSAYVREIDRESVERIARIMGRHSASAAALREADKHDGPCCFYQALDHRTGSHIIVKRLASTSSPGGTKEER